MALTDRGLRAMTRRWEADAARIDRAFPWLDGDNLDFATDVVRHLLAAVEQAGSLIDNPEYTEALR